MTGLVLKLRPAERILINGVVIENGDRRARLNIVTPDAHILRLRDAIHPSEASTPVTRVCYTAQLILAGELASDDGQVQLCNELAQLSYVFTEDPAKAMLQQARLHADSGLIYQALRILKGLRPIEAALFSQVTPHAAQ